MREFVCDGSRQPMVTKVQARNMTHSLKSWMLEKSDWNMLYKILRVIELLHLKKMAGVFKKLIQSDNFLNAETDSVAKCFTFSLREMTLKGKRIRSKEQYKRYKNDIILKDI